MARVHVVAGLLTAAACGPAHADVLVRSVAETPAQAVGSGQTAVPARLAVDYWRPFEFYGVPRSVGPAPAPARIAPPMPRMYFRVPPASALRGYHNPAARYAQDTRTPVSEPEEKGPVQEVVTTGAAAIGDGGRQAARQAAIQQALRSAIEKVAGVYVSGSTVNDRFLTVKDRVITHSDGFVVPGEVLEEKAEQGAVAVRMRATVSLRPLITRLRELGLTHNWKVAVALFESENAGIPGAAPLAETELVQGLLRAGFQLVSLPKGSAPDPSALVQALQRQGKTPVADLLITGTSAAGLAARIPVSLGTEVLRTVPLYQSRVDLRAVRVETGEVISSHVVDEVASDDVEGLAAGAAVQVAARRAARMFTDDIMVLPASFTRRVQLEARGFRTRTRAQAFEDALPLLAGVRKVQRHEYVDGCLSLDLEVDSDDAEHLGTDLEQSPVLRDFGVTVDSDTKARVVARVGK